MENIFIKNIINPKLFENTPSLIIDGIFDYNPEKINLVSFTKNTEEFEIIDKELDEEIKKKKDEMLNFLNNEKKRVIKVLEHLIVNIDFNKINLPFYKIYNYDNISNFMKTKIKKHLFDINKFNIKNGINKNKELIISKFSKMTNIENKVYNEIKLATFYILIQIIELFNIYFKSIYYSIELINDNPLNTNEDYLININENFFNINDDEIIINHQNFIKNTYNKNKNYSNIINIKKKSNEIFFK